MNTLSTDKLADLIDKRHRCLLQLRDLGQKQAQLINAGDMGSLLRLISAKNQMIAALQSIEQALAPYHAQDPEQRQWNSEATRAQCAQLANACQQLLAEVMELEQQNERNMIERRDKVASQLQAVQNSTTARGAYQAHQYSSTTGPHHPQKTPLTSLPHQLQPHQLDLQSEV